VFQPDLDVQAGVYEEFAEQSLRRQEVRAAKVGNGFEDGVNQGPMIEEAALQKVERHVKDAVDLGARLLVRRGKPLPGVGAQFFEPTVVADATADMLCAKEETFWPVCAHLSSSPPSRKPFPPPTLPEFWTCHDYFTA